MYKHSIHSRTTLPPPFYYFIYSQLIKLCQKSKGQLIDFRQQLLLFSNTCTETAKQRFRACLPEAGHCIKPVSKACLRPRSKRQRHYCSICLPRKPAAESRSFCSTSPMRLLLSFCKRTTLPITSPSHRMGVMASCW